MRIRYELNRVVEGELGELAGWTDKNLVTAVTLDEVTATMANLAFMVETVAHFQGREGVMLPEARKARELLARLGHGIVDTNPTTSN